MEAQKKQPLDEQTGGSGIPPAGAGIRAAIWAGKALIALTRMLGRGGTTLPGRTALQIAPDLNTVLAGRLPRGSIIVTGTNGKTTTAALLDDILEQSGLKCIHNQSGSNMSWGVASAFIEHASWGGRMTGDCAVMEVDEGAFPQVAGSIRPRGVIITNIFRDQLDRYGEIDSIRALIKKGLATLPESGFLVINADDPSLAGIEDGSGVQTWTYGLELDLPAGQFENTGRDVKTCPVCRRKLAYTRTYFAHLGHYHCPSCTYRRPEPDVKLTGRLTGSGGAAKLEIRLPDEELQVAFTLPGIYNLYNLLAAVTCARALEIPAETIKTALGKAAPSFGRMEEFVLGSKKLVMALIKNPVGANEVLRTVLERPDKIVLLAAINDKIADGTDVSWLWDVDFEQLPAARERISTVIASGLRAWDMAVRFKYAGFDPRQVKVEEDTGRAVSLALEQSAPGQRIYILPTYTAMLEIRRAMNKMGLGSPYWEEH